MLVSHSTDELEKMKPRQICVFCLFVLGFFLEVLRFNKFYLGKYSKCTFQNSTLTMFLSVSNINFNTFHIQIRY